MKTVYVAFDGSIFEDKRECEIYELKESNENIIWNYYNQTLRKIPKVKLITTVSSFYNEKVLTNEN